jgi:hypothetical protein
MKHFETYNRERTKGTDIVREALIEQNRFEFSMAIGLWVTASVFFLLSLSLNKPAFRLGWGLLFVCGLIVLFTALKNYRYEKNAFYKMVVYKPQNVVWVYHQVTSIMPYGIQLFRRFTIYIHTIDGKCYNLQVKGKHIIPLLKYIELIMPQATFGHSIKKEQLYKASPAMLLRD